MPFGGPVVQIILLALVAGFVALRLYSVLGRRTGHEQPVPKAGDIVSVAAPSRPAPVEPPRNRAEDGELIRPAAVDGVRAIVAADPSFDALRFLGGARSAYGMILDAFWKGDEAEIARFAAPDVAAAFAHAIAERTTAGHRLDNRLVGIERAQVERAELTGRRASITVRFDGDVAGVTRDADGQVIAGSMTDAFETHDLWTFSRELKSADPNWILVETDEA